MYREYYISSLKIEYRSTHIDPGNAAGIFIRTINCGTAMDRLIAYPAPVNEFLGAIDQKPFDVTRPFKRFYKVAKYARQKSLVWRSSQDALTGANGAFNVLPNCQTNIHCFVAGLGAGAIIGEVFVTYYVRFHHRTRV